MKKHLVIITAAFVVVGIAQISMFCSNRGAVSDLDGRMERVEGRLMDGSK